MMMMIIIFIV